MDENTPQQTQETPVEPGTAPGSNSQPNPAPVDNRAQQLFRELAEKHEAIRRDQEEFKSHIERAKRLEELEQLAHKPGGRAQVLERLGIKYEDLVGDMITGGPQNKDPEYAQLQRQVEQLTQQLETQRKQTEEETLRETVVSSIKAAADKYPTIAATGQEDNVYRMIMQHYNSTGEILPEHQAAEMLENHLASLFDKALENENLRQRFTSKYVKQQSTAKPIITNTNASSPATESNQRLTREEQMAKMRSMLIALRDKQ